MSESKRGADRVLSPRPPGWGCRAGHSQPGAGHHRARSGGGSRARRGDRTVARSDPSRRPPGRPQGGPCAAEHPLARRVPAAGAAAGPGVVPEPRQPGGALGREDSRAGSRRWSSPSTTRCPARRSSGTWWRRDSGRRCCARSIPGPATWSRSPSMRPTISPGPRASPRERVQVVYNPVITPAMMALARQIARPSVVRAGTAAGRPWRRPAHQTEGLSYAAPGLRGRTPPPAGPPDYPRGRGGSPPAGGAGRASSASARTWPCRASATTPWRTWPARRCSCSRRRGRGCRRC